MKRHFEFQDDKSSKFWEIEMNGSSVTTCWGKIGTDGQSKCKEFDSETKAKAEYEKLVKEKTVKGYVESALSESGSGNSSPTKTPVLAASKSAESSSQLQTTAKPSSRNNPAKKAPLEEEEDDEFQETEDFSAEEDFDDEYYDEENLEEQDEDEDESDIDDDDDDRSQAGYQGGERRRFEFQEGSSSKFWEIEQDECNLTTYWGRLGTPGQSKTLEFDSEAEAQKQYKKLIAEKEKKGYEEV